MFKLDFFDKLRKFVGKYKKIHGDLSKIAQKILTFKKHSDIFTFPGDKTLKTLFSLNLLLQGTPAHEEQLAVFLKVSFEASR